MAPADLKPERPDSPVRSSSPDPHFGAHDFVPSEFASDSGKCDTCGQFQDAPVHTWVDPQIRIANALELIGHEMGRIGDVLEACTVVINHGGEKRFDVQVTSR